MKNPGATFLLMLVLVVHVGCLSTGKKDSRDDEISIAKANAVEFFQAAQSKEAGRMKGLLHPQSPSDPTLIRVASGSVEVCALVSDPNQSQLIFQITLTGGERYFAFIRTTSETNRPLVYDLLEVRSADQQQKPTPAAPSVAP